MMNIKVALGQIRSEYCDLQKNAERHCEWTKNAQDKGADIIIFPELSLTGYYLREAVHEVAVDLYHPAVQQLIGVSKGIVIVAGFVEKGRKEICYNSAIVCENGQILGIHRKLRLPTYGMFEEERYFSSGNKLKTFVTSWGTVGIAICEDAWHPDLVMGFAKKNIDALIIISASPVKGVTKEKGIINLQTNAAISRLYAKNLNVPVVFVNKVGYENGICFWGGSEVYAAGGKKGDQASLIDEDLAIANIVVESKRGTNNSNSSQKVRRPVSAGSVV